MTAMIVLQAVACLGSRRRPGASPGAGGLVDLALGLFPGVPVPLLELAEKLVLPAGDLGDFVVGELAPLLANLARELLPVALDLVPVQR